MVLRVNSFKTKEDLIKSLVTILGKGFSLRAIKELVEYIKDKESVEIKFVRYNNSYTPYFYIEEFETFFNKGIMYETHIDYAVMEDKIVPGYIRKMYKIKDGKLEDSKVIKFSRPLVESSNVLIYKQKERVTMEGNRTVKDIIYAVV